MRSLLRQITLLNCILIVVIFMFSYFVLLPAYTNQVKVPVRYVAPKTVEQKAQAAEPPNPPMPEYAVVAEKNLFHPDRIIPPIKTEIAVPRPEFILYGTLIADNVSIAYLSDSKVPRTTAGRGPRQTSLKIGETMSGYTLKEVLHDSVVMVHGDDRIVVGVTADSKKKRGVTATAASTPTPPGTVAPVPPASAIPQIQRSVAAPPIARRGRY